ncbi:hypothetical protein E8E13_010614 [Curvularia kusanoi]|uniref:Homologous-pairing protein 2 winged helix domain-containing protein n=1 Tax=Curvularia kusanoi TaxID=90978 RepID=A0A9P4TG47_CURKU|nr:hypothetical protein E8E13_010614 [Curvularia kusanoi]
MGPRKEKKATSAEGSDMILHYLRTTNRPYSAIEISENLLNKVTKAATAKLLKDLHEQKLVEGRTSGKSVVYHALQDPNDAVTSEQLTEYDNRIRTLKDQTADLENVAKTLRTTLASLNSSLSTADMLSSITSLEREKAEIMARLDSLRAGHAEKVTPEEREKVEREWRVMKGVSARREKIAKEFWKTVEEMTESKEKCAELREGWGLDE